MGRRYAITSVPDAPGHAAVRARSGRVRRVFAGAFRTWHGVVQLVRGAARLHTPSAAPTFGAVFIGDGPERAGRAGRRRRPGRRDLHRRASRTRSCRRAWPRPTSASRRSTSARTRRCARLLLVAAEDLRVHGRRPAGRRAGPRPPPRLVEHGREGLLYDPASPRRPGQGARERWPIRRSGGRLGARRARARGPRLQLGGALRAARRALAHSG